MINSKVLIDIEVNNNKANKQLDETKAKVENLGTAGKTAGGNVSSSFANMASKALLAVGAIALITKALSDISSQARQAQLGFTKLLGAVGNLQSANNISEFASQMQALTIHTDDEVLSISTLIKNLNQGISDTQLKNVTKAVIGISDATGKSIQTVSRAAARGLQGNTTQLQRMGIQVDKNASKTQIYNSMVEQGNKFFQTSIALANTHSGQMIVLANQWGEVKKQMGKTVNATIAGFIEMFNKTTGSTEKTLKVISDAFKWVFGGLALGITAIIQELGVTFATIIHLVYALGKTIVLVFKTAGIAIYNWAKQSINNFIAMGKALGAAITLNFTQAAAQIGNIKLAPDISALVQGVQDIGSTWSEFGKGVGSYFSQAGESITAMYDKIFQMKQTVVGTGSEEEEPPASVGTGGARPSKQQEQLETRRLNIYNRISRALDNIVSKNINISRQQQYINRIISNYNGDIVSIGESYAELLTKLTENNAQLQNLRQSASTAAREQLSIIEQSINSIVEENTLLEAGLNIRQKAIQKIKEDGAALADYNSKLINRLELEAKLNQIINQANNLPSSQAVSSQLALYNTQLDQARTRLNELLNAPAGTAGNEQQIIRTSQYIKQLTDNIYNLRSQFGMLTTAQVWAERMVDIGKRVGQIFSGLVDTISNGLGNAFANLIVSGQNFGNSMKKIWKSVATSVIAQITAIITKMLILAAIDLMLKAMGITLPSYATAGNKGNDIPSGKFNIWSLLGGNILDGLFNGFSKNNNSGSSTVASSNVFQTNLYNSTNTRLDRINDTLQNWQPITVNSIDDRTLARKVIIGNSQMLAIG